MAKLVALAFLVVCVAQPDKEVDEALAIAGRVTGEVEGASLLHVSGPKEDVAADATNAHKAANVAKEAATVAKKVAMHSIKMTRHAQDALQSAHDAVNRARVDTEGLSIEQKHSLKQAEKKLQEATKDAEYGEVKDAKYVKVEVKNKKLKKMDKEMDVIKEKTHKQDDSAELEEMRKELEELRKKLRENNDNSNDKAIKELEEQIEEMEKAEKKEDKSDAKSHDEMKAEMERLREMIDKLEKEETSKPVKKAKVERKIPPLAPAGNGGDSEEQKSEAVRVEKSLDIDTAMPYGDLEPFGREDTAQELTEASIRESDSMVDQLERAEVAEEKRAVFRALTRLRGAAITSFDGVARSQTGNIDEYNKVNQWRGTHPLHHLADEESDVSKWAFPDNAD